MFLENDTIIEHVPIHVPTDYVNTTAPWGTLYYKIYNKMKYLDAKNQCENDGAELAYPKSGNDSIKNVYYL